MKRILLALLLLALPMAAQEEKKPEPRPPEPVTKVIMLQYADANQIRELLSVFGVSMVPNSAMHALAVRGGLEAVAAVEDAIKRLDVPAAAPKNIDFTVYLLVGSEAENPAGSAALPKDLGSVVTQLKNAFAFKNYGLLDVLQLRTRTGQQASATSSASIQFPTGTRPVTTQLSIRSASIGTDGVTVRIDNLQSSTKMPVPMGSGSDFTYQDLGTRADIDIREGQKVVVGRLGISRDQALFLVLTAKIVP